MCGSRPISFIGLAVRKQLQQQMRTQREWIKQLLPENADQMLWVILWQSWHLFHFVAGIVPLLFPRNRN